MIHPDSRTLAWIEKVAKENNVKDIALAEKATFFYWNEIQKLM